MAAAGKGFAGIMVDRSVCTGDEKEINDALESFPSGHSTAAWAGFLFLSWYLNAKLKIFANCMYWNTEFCLLESLLIEYFLPRPSSLLETHPLLRPALGGNSHCRLPNNRRIPPLLRRHRWRDHRCMLRYGCIPVPVCEFVGLPLQPCTFASRSAGYGVPVCVGGQQGYEAGNEEGRMGNGRGWNCWSAT